LCRHVAFSFHDSNLGISFTLPRIVTAKRRVWAGTPDYSAPEMHKSSGRLLPKYGYKSDIWSLGILLHEMATGFRPLHALNSNFDKIQYLKHLNHDLTIEINVMPGARHAMKQCLKLLPKQRPTAEQLLSHSYFIHGI
jgi:serine/threonine protein kinase